MKTSQLTKEQRINILQQVEAGAKAADLCRLITGLGTVRSRKALYSEPHLNEALTRSTASQIIRHPA